ncbi:hypothetical protein EF919_18090 [Streptomyces sp. WAC02707]|uniref:hypothetical protein n=1 Tax=Streptomyces TaxID=1883 RepID=UPI000F7ABEC2|nr:hypothetical protein [Streptomyces sp. WAC02707]RSS92445.1 hypothetical protein EF919_18090 [Streptomyces sp. WAC02707]
MSTYPVPYAGQRIEATLLASMMPNITWKASNTDRAATTTFEDDPDLIVSLEAGAVYHVTFYLHHAAVNTARFKTIWRVPNGATGTRSVIGPDQGAVLSGTSSGGQGRYGVHNFDTACTYGCRDNNTLLCAGIEEAVVVTADAGTLAVQWAQATSSATFSRLGAGSSLHVRRLA